MQVTDYTLKGVSGELYQSLIEVNASCGSSAQVYWLISYQSLIEANVRTTWQRPGTGFPYVSISLIEVNASGCLYHPYGSFGTGYQSLIEVNARTTSLFYPHCNTCRRECQGFFPHEKIKKALKSCSQNASI